MPSNTGYPAFFVGQRLTATLLTSAQEISAWKIASTSRNTTISRTADPDLTLSVEANSLYTGKFVIVYSSTSVTPGLNWSFGVPAGATGHYTYTAGQTTTDTNIYFAIASGGGPPTINGTLGLSGQFWLDTAATAGTFSINWAQLVSNAANVTLEAGCYMTLKRQE
jgi:hypothetical protein